MPNRSSRSSGAVFRDRAQAVEEVRRAATRLAAERPGVLEIWLFGSLARGDATPRSDADLLIIFGRDDRRPMDRAPEFLRLLGGVGRPVDMIVATADEWRARVGSRFYTEVQTRGQRLYP